MSDELAREGLKRARAAKPDPFFSADAARLITTGGFDTDLPALATADWIIEAVVERLDVKQALFAKIDALTGLKAIVSSNTSGIPLAALARGTLANASVNDSSARTSSIRRATCICSS